MREAKRLEWGRKCLTAADLATLGMLLPMCSSLTHLFLYSNQIGDEGANALAAGVAASSSLTHLDLDDNKIGDEGAKALAAGVVVSSSLTTLCLNSHNIGD